MAVDNVDKFFRVGFIDTTNHFLSYTFLLNRLVLNCLYYFMNISGKLFQLINTHKI